MNIQMDRDSTYTSSLVTVHDTSQSLSMVPDFLCVNLYTLIIGAYISWKFLENPLHRSVSLMSCGTNATSGPSYYCSSIEE